MATAAAATVTAVEAVLANQIRRQRFKARGPLKTDIGPINDLVMVVWRLRDDLNFITFLDCYEKYLSVFLGEEIRFRQVFPVFCVTVVCATFPRDLVGLDMLAMPDN